MAEVQRRAYGGGSADALENRKEGVLRERVIDKNREKVWLYGGV